MNLGIYGDGGSMRGSGIGSLEIEREFTCRSCSWEGSVIGSTDDSQNLLYAECPNCKDEMTIDLAMENDPMYAEPDYDSWVD